MEFGEYSISALKQFDTPDGGGYNLNILRNGKKVATAFEGGHGGEVQIEWLDTKPARVDINTTNYKGEPHTYQGTPEEKLFIDFLATLPNLESEYSEGGLKICEGIFLDEIINDFNARKEAKKLLRKSFIFHHSSYKQGEYMPYPRKFKGRDVTPEMAQKAADRDIPGNKHIESFEQMKEVGIL